MELWYQNGKYTLIPSGQYSITKNYNAMLYGLERCQVADLVWIKAMQPKHKFIVWLTNQNKLLTNERLQKVHISLANITCSICEDGAVEIMQHLFVDCE